MPASGAGPVMENPGTLIAAAIIMLGFGLFAYFLPALMMAAGDISPVAGALVALIFMVALFAVFWLRGRYKRKGGED